MRARASRLAQGRCRARARSPAPLRTVSWRLQPWQPHITSPSRSSPPSPGLQWYIGGMLAKATRVLKWGRWLLSFFAKAPPAA